MTNSMYGVSVYGMLERRRVRWRLEREYEENKNKRPRIMILEGKQGD